MNIYLVIQDKVCVNIEKKIKKIIGTRFCCNATPRIFEIEEPSSYITNERGLLYLRLKNIRKRKSDYSVTLSKKSKKL
jgi:hypothetical protein